MDVIEFGMSYDCQGAAWSAVVRTLDAWADPELGYVEFWGSDRLLVLVFLAPAP